MMNWKSLTHFCVKNVLKYQTSTVPHYQEKQ